MNKIVVFLLILPQLVAGQASISKIRQFSDSLIAKSIGDTLIPGVGLSIFQNDSVFVSHYGMANLEKKIPVDETTLFQLGSVGKLFTVIAVLQQVEKGTLDLQKDVNDYLKEFMIDDNHVKPITLQNLLTHTAGLDDQVIGYLARTEKEVEPLAQHLKKNMPKTFGICVALRDKSGFYSGDDKQKRGGVDRCPEEFCALMRASGLKITCPGLTKCF